MNDILKCPKTGKRSFPDEVTATEWNNNNFAQYGGVRKFVYACEDCDQWHLTASPPGNNTIAQVNYEPGVPFKKRIDTDEVVRMRTSGLSVQQLADHFNVSTEAIKYHIRKSEGKIPSKYTPAATPLMTYEQYNLKRVELEQALGVFKREFDADLQSKQAEIDRVRQIEERLYLDRQLKITYGTDGAVILKKYDREFDLTRDEITKLLDEVSKPESRPA
jgi:predicted DNA-binding protein YlxM (UPF0122 family)